MPRLIDTPHEPQPIRPSAGTSTPSPTRTSASPDLAATSTPSSRTASVELEGTSLTLHHSPPPSAPSYTTGSVPPLLQWLGGTPVRLTGQENAPLRRARRGMGGRPLWDSGVKREIIEMRQRGMSRSAIATQLSIPVSQHQHIARAAPLSPEQRAAKEAAKIEEESRWGYNKRLSQAKREKRKEFW